MRFATLLPCCCAAALALGCSGPDPGPGRANAPGPALAGSDSPTTPLAQPRIVVQLGHGAPVVAVRWVDDGRHLASIARDGSLVFWQVAGGVILGVLEGFGAAVISSEWKNVFAFVILIIILLIRPNGLFGSRVVKKV